MLFAVVEDIKMTSDWLRCLLSSVVDGGIKALFTKFRSDLGNNSINYAQIMEIVLSNFSFFSII